MFLTADPLEMGGTAGTLTALTSAFTSGNAAAAAPTTAVAPGHGPVRILRDLTCPNCNWPELGQTFNLSGTGTVLLYCRKCEHGCEADFESKEKK